MEELIESNQWFLEERDTIRQLLAILCFPVQSVFLSILIVKRE